MRWVLGEGKREGEGWGFLVVVVVYMRFLDKVFRGGRDFAFLLFFKFVFFIFLVSCLIVLVIIIHVS